MPIIVCRHGTTEWNRLHKWQGHTDIELSSDGIEEAKKHAESQKEHPIWKNISHIYASPLKRAHKTAEVISEVVKQATVVVETDERLKESGLGKYEGLTLNEILTQHAEKVAELRGMTAQERMNGRYDTDLECPREAASRIIVALEDYERRFPDDVVLVVTHSQMLYSILATVLEIHFEKMHSNPLAWFIWNKRKISEINDITNDKQPIVPPA